MLMRVVASAGIRRENRPRWMRPRIHVAGGRPDQKERSRHRLRHAPIAQTPARSSLGGRGAPERTSCGRRILRCDHARRYARSRWAAKDVVRHGRSTRKKFPL